MSRQKILIGFFILSGSIGHAQDLLVYGLIRELSSKGLLIGATVTIADSQLVTLDRWVTGDSGDYEFYLQMDQIYTLRCSAPGYFAKSVVLDTRKVDASEEEREGGWGMNIDMTMYRTFDGVDTTLLNVPFGYAAWSSNDTMFVWDMAHTERIRAQWATVLPSREVGIPPPAIASEREMEPPLWSRFALAIGLILLGRWGFDLLFARIGEHVATRQRVLIAMLAGAAVFGCLAWLYWSAERWDHVLAFGAAVASVGLVIAAAQHSGPVLDQRLGDGMPIPQEERERGRRILKGMNWSIFLLTILCSFVMFYAMDRTLHGEARSVYLVGWALAVFVLLLLILHRPSRSWLVHPADRLRFWSVLGVALLFLIPTGMYLLDRMLAGPASSRLAEIVALNEVSGRKGRTTFHALVLVDGIEKDIRLDKEEWDELTHSDALSLTIQRGPAGIDHITAWDRVHRGKKGAGE